MVEPAGHGTGASWQLPLSGWTKLFVRTWKEQSRDNISLASAGVAFYAFLALVPLLAAIVLTYGIAADRQTVLRNMKALTSVLPGDIARLIGDQLMNVVRTSGSKKGIGLIIALAVALWGARNAATSIISALNIAYEQPEKRNAIRVNLLALAITCGGVAMAVLALLAMTIVGYLQRRLAQLPDLFIAAGGLMSYIVLLLGAAAGAATLYRYAPCHHQARWQWMTPGSLFSALTWLALTRAFGIYLGHFANYHATYGSLDTAVALLTWLYLSAYCFLFGAELNSEFGHYKAADSMMAAPERPGEPARPPPA